MSEEIIKRVLDLAEENKSLRGKLSSAKNEITAEEGKRVKVEMLCMVAQSKIEELGNENEELKTQIEELKSQLQKLRQEKLEAKWV